MPKHPPQAMITRPTNVPDRAVELPDANTEKVPPFLSRNELKMFKVLRDAGKILAMNVKSCPCGTEIPSSRSFCSVKCYKARPNET